MAVFISYNISDVEWKTLLKAIEWAKTQFDFSEAEVCRQALAEFRVCVRNQWAERLRTLESSLKAASKTATAAYYVKCIALRELATHAGSVASTTCIVGADRTPDPARPPALPLLPHVLLEELS